MREWALDHPRRKDLRLLNPESVDRARLSVLFKELRIHWSDNKKEISKEMASDLFAFHEAIEKNSEKILIDYKTVCRMLRWIKTQGNLKYDAERFVSWRAALKVLWEFLFGANYQEFYKYVGDSRYVHDQKEWEAWYRNIGGC